MQLTKYLGLNFGSIISFDTTIASKMSSLSLWPMHLPLSMHVVIFSIFGLKAMHLFEEKKTVS